MDFDKTRKVLNDIGVETALEMIRILQYKNKKATGNLIKSIDFDIIETLNGLTLQFSQEDYGEFVDRGRKKGKYAPVSKIKEWCRIKGIPEKAAFAINRKIYRFGIKPTNFMLPLFQLEKKMYDRVTESYVKDIEVYIDENIIRGLK